MPRNRRTSLAAAAAALGLCLRWLQGDMAFATTSKAIPLRDFRVGQELRGVVSYVTDTLAMVDIGAEKEGLVPISKMRGVEPNGSCFDAVRLGDDVLVWVSSVENSEDLRRSSLILSMDKDKIYGLGSEETAKAAQFQRHLGKRWFNATVTKLRPYGMFALLKAPKGDGYVEGLVHKSECPGSYGAPIGSEVRVRVLRVDLAKNRLALSMRNASEKGSFARISAFRNMTQQKLRGVVKANGKFGAFVEIPHPKRGTIVGLVPSQDQDALRRARPRSLEELEIGQELAGVVLRVYPLALVDIGLKTRGLLPTGKMRHPSSPVDSEEVPLNVGDRVQVWVSEIRANSSRKDRTSLILAMDENKIYGFGNAGPTADIEEFLGLDEQQWLTGKVARKTELGWFVNVASPRGSGMRQGLVYLPECKGDADIGAEVQVRVLRVDAEKMQMDLSMRTSPPLEGIQAKLALYRDLMDHWLEGRVKSFGAYGASVEVRHPIGGTMVGILPKSQMEPGHALQVDEMIQVRVWDVSDSGLALSMQEKVKEMPKELLELMEDELGSSIRVELLEEGQEVDVRVTGVAREGLTLALCH